MPDEFQLPDLPQTLRDLIRSLEDGRMGMVELSRHLRSEPTRQFFLRESQVRADYAAELQAELRRLDDETEKPGGTVAGTLNRIWGDLLGHLGAGDRAVLATAERGDDETTRLYFEALTVELPADLRGMLIRQQRHVLQAHNKIRSLRQANKRKPKAKAA